MSARRFRLIITGLTLVLIAIVLAAVALTPSGSDISLPEPVESVFPLPGDSVIAQQGIEIDMAVGYSVIIRVDGILIPADEIRAVEPTGLSAWQPAAGNVIESWTPGEHRVEISWDKIAGLPDQGSFSWTFRVQ